MHNIVKIRNDWNSLFILFVYSFMALPVQQ